MLKNIQLPNEDSLTPQELLERFPYARKIGWTVSDIESLFEQSILDGAYDRSGQLRILRKSFAEIIDFHKRGNREE